MVETWRVEVVGVPQPKGSFNVVRAGGKVYNISPRKTRDWSQLVRGLVAEGWRGPPLEGPVEVQLTFWLPAPKSRRQRERLVAKRPDGDKLERACWDALSGVVFRDDAQVALWSGSKHYALDRAPGVLIEVRKLEEADHVTEEVRIVAGS